MKKIDVRVRIGYNEIGLSLRADEFTKLTPEEFASKWITPSLAGLMKAVSADDDE